MEDFMQAKLTKAEWDSIERPIAAHEMRVCQLIKDGFQDVLLYQNNTPTMSFYMKLANDDSLDVYIYVQYFQIALQSLAKTYKLNIVMHEVDNTKVKKADLIRLQNTDKIVQENKTNLFEYVLLDLLKKMFKNKASTKSANSNWLSHFYTLTTLLKYHIKINKTLRTILEGLMREVEPQICVTTILSMGQEIIERNDLLLRYADETLYEHQKRLFTVCKRPNPKLVLYIAPTGTGKTLSPIGLSEGYKIIFVSAARHVGLAFAKAAISMHKKVAFAFGCNDALDIRLHYFAAKDYTKNKKTGGIGKVDNSQGEKVEIIISDIQSYLPAMLYMLAFNNKENIILYWDEPTISLDYATHDFHAIIQKNWCENLIPNVVLSSATLPQQDEIWDTFVDFKNKFGNTADIYEIVSHDCKKTIPLINREGFVEMPHLLYADYAEVAKVVKHCTKYKTLLRYIDLGEAIKFIMQAAPLTTNKRLALELNFSTVDAINMLNIKLYYLKLLGSITPAAWPEFYARMVANRVPKQVSNINIVTKDAHTLTDGPTIFLADDVLKIAHFFIQSAEIPAVVIDEIMSAIAYNSNINERVRVMQKDFEDGTKKDEGKEKKMTSEGRLLPEMKRLMQKIEETSAQIRTVVLPPVYVPNTRDHLTRHHVSTSSTALASSKPFTCEISEKNIEDIMLIDDIDAEWKLLLLMGIGVFAQHKSDRYTEIMKSLAQEEKLYLIIASSDFIYGTNYQFCHGYIGKDLGYMSQEKCIQAMGRVGRNKLQHDYSVRFRDNALLFKLFNTEENKPEVVNMNKLFKSS